MTMMNNASVLILAGGLSTRMRAPKALLKLATGDTLLDYHVREASQLGVPIFIADNEQGYTISDNLLVNRHLVQHIADYKAYNEVDTKIGSRTDCRTYCKTSKMRSPDTVVNNKLNSVKLLVSSSTSSQDGVNTAHHPKHSAGPLGAILSGMQHTLTLPHTATRDNVNYNNDNDNDNGDAELEQWMLVISCDSLVSAFDVWQLLTQSPLATLRQSASAQDSPDVLCLTDERHLYPLLGAYRLSVADVLKDYLDTGNRRVMTFVNPRCQSVKMPASWHALSNLNTPQAFATACQIINN